MEGEKEAGTCRVRGELAPLADGLLPAGTEFELLGLEGEPAVVFQVPEELHSG